jgi:hypothetical protein
MNTNEQVSAMLAALPCALYHVQAISSDRKEVEINQHWSAKTLIDRIPLLQAKNYAGFNIYFRPDSLEFILLDDLERNRLREVAELKPATLVETSNENYQAFLILPVVPNFAQAANICKSLAIKVGADQASAKPLQVARLPGFQNRKPKRKLSDGTFQSCILKKYSYRCAEIPDDYFRVPPPVLTQTSTRKSSESDRSREDFNLVCMLIRKGFKDFYIEARLAESEKSKERGERYIKLTIANARRITGIY